MNYRHSFHAGNFADVLKHATVAIVVDYLQQKTGPLFLADTHAGRGFYDLKGNDAQKTGEWREGIERLMHADLPAPIADLLAPYLANVRALNLDGAIRTYPGSPALLRQRLRPHDRALFCETNPGAASRLRQLCAGDKRISVAESDGYAALLKALPPREGRGFILIDPPYEAADEFTPLLATLSAALRRFAHGVYAIWYPLTARADESAAFLSAIATLGLAKTLTAELLVHPPQASGLVGCGMLFINQPYTLDEQLRALLPFLADKLGKDGAGSFSLHASQG